MTGMTHSSTFHDTRPMQSERDASWYGTLAVLAACLGVLVTTFFVG
jgi:hypothetical protein